MIIIAVYFICVAVSAAALGHFAAIATMEPRLVVGLILPMFFLGYITVAAMVLLINSVLRLIDLSIPPKGDFL